MQPPHNAEQLLSRVVDELVVADGGGGEPVARLVQKNAHEAVVMLDDKHPIILLTAASGARVAERITRALSAEREAVRIAFRETLITVVFVGGDVPLASYREDLPRLYEPLGAALAYLRMPLATDSVEGAELFASKDAKKKASGPLHSVEKVAAALNGLGRILPRPGGITRRPCGPSTRLDMEPPGHRMAQQASVARRQATPSLAIAS